VSLVEGTCLRANCYARARNKIEELGFNFVGIRLAEREIGISSKEGASVKA